MKLSVFARSLVIEDASSVGVRAGTQASHTNIRDWPSAGVERGSDVDVQYVRTYIRCALCSTYGTYIFVYIRVALY